MPDAEPRYCDVSLPVPVDRLFTYELPLTLRQRVCLGCRVWVPFGTRKLTGVVFRTHYDPPTQEVREVLRLLDAEPVLDRELLRLGQWIAEYYSAPLGEVLKSMLPLSGEVRRGARYSLTQAGRDVARQLIVKRESDAALRILSLLEQQPRSAEYLATKIENARNSLRTLVKRGWVTIEETHEERDPMRAPAGRLRAEFLHRAASELKLKKSERELLAFLELHPGPHNVGQLNANVKNASQAARALARRELIRLELEGMRAPTGFERPIPILNAQQHEAFEAIRGALARNEFKTFLLQGITGSGKTEVYLRSIEAALALGKNALLLVPEIALTPAMAGQFFHRFGRQVAILHSAFGDAERADQWRRIRSSEARVVVGTRSGVFAPVQKLGLVIIDEEHDASYKQQEAPRYNGRDVALVRAKEVGAVAVLGSATPSVESRYNSEHGKYGMLRLPERIAQRPLPEVQIVDMRVEFLETRRQATFSRKLLEEMQLRLGQGEQTDLAAQSPRLFEFHGMPGVWRTVAMRELRRCANPS